MFICNVCIFVLIGLHGLHAKQFMFKLTTVEISEISVIMSLLLMSK